MKIINDIKKKNKKRHTIIVYILIAIFINLIALNFLKVFNERVTPRVLTISKQKAKEVVYNVITNNVNKYVLDDSKLLKEIIDVHENDSGEIITADFNLENAYFLIRNITKSIDENISLNEEDGGIYFEVPVGYYFKSSFFSNYGPRIPVKINFTGNILSNLKTKITNYGMNNALLELYANINITEEIITPVSKNYVITNYDVLLASKLISGRVPSFYGNSLEAQSKIFDVSNE